ncbi:MAG: NlpC/P60 family protein, partial [Actinomycetota bacterium]|nr:NlpC/P60 family protein [Actinomycetota bacterium]
MRRVCALVMGLAMLMATPGLATADTRSATNQKAVEIVIARAMSQRGVPFAYGGGGASGPSKGTVAAPEPDEAESDAAALGLNPSNAEPNTPAPGMNLPTATDDAASSAPRVEAVGFDASGLMVYAYAGVGVKLPRSSGAQYQVGQKVTPEQALPGDLIFYGPEGT